ncbi:LysR substrate-binding domain-containing protein [Amycolatopsis mongoliensis]|uniref:LysR substrate-binding domain-containing protein n=1 Tax=Amycolatopsis mongoliensis TaxID=715475 RepID=A0A9Y2JZ45_9PSEU|nr:LysR substrate-binding domain-containing protein [Amycolatopsis sp. 4-36]WIY07421.1 LysR substrate-binding domain-containing protein [Amycolatopsis sp. 4-36]
MPVSGRRTAEGELPRRTRLCPIEGFDRAQPTRPGYWPRELADRLFAAAGLDPEYTCESDEPGATGDLIGAGLGVGLVPAFSRGVTHIPAVWLRLDAPDCHRTLSLVWRESAYLSVAAQRLSDFAAGYFGRLWGGRRSARPEKVSRSATAAGSPAAAARSTSSCTRRRPGCCP